MGEAADDLTEGWVCSECGIYFEQPHGYPVLCKECYRRAPRSADYNGLQEATVEELG